MKRFTSLGIATSLAMVLALLFSTPAAAFELIQLSGNYGDFGTKIATSDGPDTPGAKCGYSAKDAMNVAHLAWMKVYPFKAVGYDRTGSTDSQKIQFKVTVQRSQNDGASWKNVGSVAQTRTTTDAKSAKFTSLTVNVSGKAGQIFRAITTLTWLYQGHVDGIAKARMEYYGVKWTVGSPDFVYHDACDGAAD